MRKNPLDQICGALHLHTQYSDGGVDISEMVAAASEVGLDFIIVTDHMSLQARKQGFEGFSHNVYLHVGYEHQDNNNRNHYLAIGVNSLAKNTHIPQKYINEIKAMGGVGFIAHPAEKRHYYAGLPSYPWTDWSVTNFDGIELWNQMSDWVEHLKNWRSFIRIMFPRRLMADAPPELLLKWDELNRHRFVSAIGGVDAHTRKYGFGLIHVTIFPVKVELKGIRTHVYLPEPFPMDNTEKAQRMLIDSLRDGHAFISNYKRGDAKGTQIFVRYDDNTIAPPGIQPSSQSVPKEIEVQIPDRGQIILVKNGGECKKISGLSAAFEVSEPGSYRIEVKRKNHAWIYSNPFPLGNYPLY